LTAEVSKFLILLRISFVFSVLFLTMITLEPFQESDFDALISWIDTKELLVTIAGNVFTFPVTHDQLQKYLEDNKSVSFTIRDGNSNNAIGHAEIVLATDGTCKIDKLLIGDKSQRGKGIGEQVMNELVRYAFEQLPVHTVELNVFDWNKAGIRCYEKVGFIMNPGKVMYFEVNGESWLTLNMILTRDSWNKMRI